MSEGKSGAIFYTVHNVAGKNLLLGEQQLKIQCDKTNENHCKGIQFWNVNQPRRFHVHPKVLHSILTNMGFQSLICLLKN
jgi:hypothetical protein